MPKTTLKILLVVLLLSGILASGPVHRIAAAAEISIEGAVYHVHRSNGSHKTYLDIVVDPSFPGKLPDDIDSITVTGPNGEVLAGTEDFEYTPQWRVFLAVRSGFPELGNYSFKLVSGDLIGYATDTQSTIKTIPLPDVSRFKPARAATDSGHTSTFSWASINADEPLFYQLQIRDADRRHVYRTDFIKDMLSVRIPPDTLLPGRSYQWRVRVADDSNWVGLNNRTQSKWVTFTRGREIEPCAYPYARPHKTEDGLEVSTLKDENIDPEKIEALMLDILNGNIQDIHSLLMLKNGKLVLEEYFGGYARNKPHNIASVSKSITSIVFGIARDQKKIPAMDQKIQNFFPEYKDLDWDEQKRDIRLKHVLTMTAGFNWNTWNDPDSGEGDSTKAMARSDDWIKFALERKMANPPGAKFIYNNGLTLFLGEIIAKTTGLSADILAEQYLFGPLGIANVSWQKLPDGRVNTAWGVQLRPRDMVKIGYMMLKEGKWNEQQIVSSSWVRQSTQEHVTGNVVMGSGYGYQWWRGQAFANQQTIDLFYAAGHGGQYIFVCPKLDLVVVFTSDTSTRPLAEFKPQIIMVNYIIPAMLPQSSPRQAIQLDPAIVEAYLGDYEYKRLGMRVRIFKDGDVLYFKIPDEETGMLFAETETQFFGRSKEVGEFQLNFVKDQREAITHFMVQVGFGTWLFDKIK